VLEESIWVLYNLSRFDEAVTRAGQVVGLRERMGDPAAGALLERAWRTATRTNSVQAIALAGIARVESAWLAGDHRAADELARVPLERTAVRGAERYHGELLRYLARCGHPVPAPAGCPPEFALGIRGDWRGAAELWRLGVTRLPAGPAPAPAPTRPASPTASSRSSACSPRASPTPRSPTAWSSRSAPSTTTSPPSWPSSTSPPAARPAAPPATWTDK
jgi:hypothetical protein